MFCTKILSVYEAEILGIIRLPWQPFLVRFSSLKCVSKDSWGHKMYLALKIKALSHLEADILQI